MGVDRVIQDSDEDEPFERDGDELPPSVAPLKPSEPAFEQEQYHDIPAEHQQMTHYAMHEHGPTPDESVLPQMNVNFDEFLQSQERSHAMSTSSQQRREERWIPSTSEGGSGSVGAMMTEIGLAQRRLLDDESSSGAQLQSAAALFTTTESIQSAPFPTIPSSHSYPFNEGESISFPYPGGPHGAYAETNQSPLPNGQGAYDLTPPDTTTNSMAPPPRSGAQQPSELFTELPSALPNQLQQGSQPRPQQPDPSSPHDTEPLSSIITLRYSGLKPDTTDTSLVSPQYSQSSAHDELALPAAVPAIDAPIAPKKRRRANSVPDSDEDDELSNSRDHEFRRTPGANGTTDPSDTEEITENNSPVSSGALDDETDEENIEPVPKAMKIKSQDLKKKKVKKAKTKSTPNPGADEDDVVWLDTKPREMQPSSKKTTPQMEIPETRDREPTPLISVSMNGPDTPKASTPIEEKRKAQEPPTPEKPAPKKRTRKRKQPIETEIPDTETATPEPTELPGTKAPATNLAVVVNNSSTSMSTNANDESGMQATQEQEQEQAQQKQQNAESATDQPAAATTAVPLPPQTPPKPNAKAVNTPVNAGKGPDKHSPISARSAVPYRVGLSKRARIAPLLKMVRK
ncbi:hypothetical protein N7461_002991 [Penicillium sp. DV-2018c]|nr:hypothetical protein N7461_002991 [Penicillium sp. DV-2018c]